MKTTTARPPKEDRSGWVAVESDLGDVAVQVRPAASAYSLFQKSAFDKVTFCYIHQYARRLVSHAFPRLITRSL